MKEEPGHALISPVEEETIYRVEKNGLRNIAKQDPGRAEQGTKSSNKVHQTMHNPLFSTL